MISAFGVHGLNDIKICGVWYAAKFVPPREGEIDDGLVCKSSRIYVSKHSANNFFVLAYVTEVGSIERRRFDTIYYNLLHTGRCRGMKE